MLLWWPRSRLAAALVILVANRARWGAVPSSPRGALKSGNCPGREGGLLSLCLEKLSQQQQDGGQWGQLIGQKAGRLQRPSPPRRPGLSDPGGGTPLSARWGTGFLHLSGASPLEQLQERKGPVGGAWPAGSRRPGAEVQHSLAEAAPPASCPRPAQLAFSGHSPALRKVHPELFPCTTCRHARPFLEPQIRAAWVVFSHVCASIVMPWLSAFRLGPGDALAS